MNIGICVKKDCEAMTVPDKVYCAPHLAQVQGKSGIVEPEAEARARAARSEDDLHPGERKIYDRETGEASWVPIEEVPRQVEDLQRRSSPAMREMEDALDAYHARQYYPTESHSADVGILIEYLEGRHGMMAEMVARAMLAGMVAALRRL